MQTGLSQCGHTIAQGPGELKFRFLRLLSPLKVPPSARPLRPAPAKVVTIHLELAIGEPETGRNRMFLEQQEETSWLQGGCDHLCPPGQIWQPDQDSPTGVDILEGAGLQVRWQPIEISGEKTGGETSRCGFLPGQLDLLLADIHPGCLRTRDRPGERIFPSRALQMEQATPPHLSCGLQLACIER